MNRVIWVKQVSNKNKKWYEFWKPALVSEKYYLRIEDGFVILDEKTIEVSK